MTKHNYPKSRKRVKRHTVKSHSRRKPLGGETKVSGYTRGKKRRRK